ncbi:hypothetical protein NQ318_003483 [Aromia moschata]|uniref:glucose-6-phosphate 1-epimerase n=1 Tax=Aromia moschata TaxID=1265417 RepID=A0AAV8YV61_9CUCU|nr:hypothetical protein NQ318_003483 [Aromia moschata]
MAATSVVVLDRGNNTTCTINLHGATVVSWRVNNQEQLFVRFLLLSASKQYLMVKKQSEVEYHLFFTQFGPWTFGPQHGFARIVRWNLEKAPERLASGDVEAVFSIMDTDFTRSMWNYQFRLTYRLILREKELHFNIAVYNPSKDLTFSFNMLLHTYFKVPDVRRCQITGLQGCTFIDKSRDGAVYQEFEPVATVKTQNAYPFPLKSQRCCNNRRMDRQSLPEHSARAHNNKCGVRSKDAHSEIQLPRHRHLEPWVDQAKDMSDFGDDEYPNMVCVEAGHVSSPVILLPGTAFEASQILQVM